MTMLPLPSIRIPEKNPLVDLTDDAIAGLLDQFDDRRDDQLAEDDVARIISLPIAG